MQRVEKVVELMQIELKSNAVLVELKHDLEKKQAVVRLKSEIETKIKRKIIRSISINH